MGVLTPSSSSLITAPVSMLAMERNLTAGRPDLVVWWCTGGNSGCPRAAVVFRLGSFGRSLSRLLSCRVVVSMCWTMNPPSGAAVASSVYDSTVLPPHRTTMACVAVLLTAIATKACVAVVWTTNNAIDVRSGSCVARLFKIAVVLDIATKACVAL